MEDANCIVHSVKSEVEDALSILDGAISTVSAAFNEADDAQSILDGANSIVSRVICSID